MTVSQLACLRMVLERARLLLEPREDEEAVDLRHDVRNVIGGIAWLEASPSQDVTTRNLGEVAAAGRSLIDRVNAYAAAHRLKFGMVATPFPSSGQRHDTQPMSLAEIHAAIGSMPSGATEPPSSVQRAIVEAQLLPTISDEQDGGDATWTEEGDE